MGEISDVQYLVSRNRIWLMDMLINQDPANVIKRSAEIDKTAATIDTRWKAFLATGKLFLCRDLVVCWFRLG